MKRFLLGSASVAAVVFGMSGSASAQLVDIGDLANGILGAVNVDALENVNIGALNGLVALPDGAGVNGVYLNSAVNVAPQVAANANVSLPVDPTVVAGIGGLAASLGLGVSPNTGSAAVAIDTAGLADIVASLSGNLTIRDQTATAVGVLANQGIQTAATTVTVATDNSTLGVVGPTLVSTDEATQAASQAGSAAANSAARFARVNYDGGALTAVNNTVDNSIDGALTGVYAANTALNVAPQIAANINVATGIVGRDLSATAVGVLANQATSIGLNGAGLAGALTGNVAGAVNGGGGN